MDELRKNIPGEEFDYQILMDALRGYLRPRSKVTSLLEAGDIVRIKKGIYIFGARHRRRPYSREILANLIYGPSCLSLEFALHFHGIIPERVERLPSVAIGRGRNFSTAVGNFSYHRVPLGVFPIGITRVDRGGGQGFLMANPERALADKVFLERGLSVTSRREMEDYLFKNLRLDPERIMTMDPDVLTLYGKRGGSRKVRLVAEVVRSFKGLRHE